MKFIIPPVKIDARLVSFSSNEQQPWESGYYAVSIISAEYALRRAELYIEDHDINRLAYWDANSSVWYVDSELDQRISMALFWIGLTQFGKELVCG